MRRKGGGGGGIIVKRQNVEQVVIYTENFHRICVWVVAKVYICFVGQQKRKGFKNNGYTGSRLQQMAQTFVFSWGDNHL